MSEAVARTRSIMAALAAGNVLDPGDAAWLYSAFDIWIHTDVHIERAMSQPRKFKEKIRVAAASEVLLQAFPGHRTDELEERIRRYRNSRDFETHRKNGTAPDDRDRRALHHFLVSYQGGIPSVRTLQHWKWLAQRSGGLDCAGPVAYSGNGKANINTDILSGSLRKARSQAS
jgi:hypothetical protein